jgi:hypothetical protein
MLPTTLYITLLSVWLSRNRILLLYIIQCRYNNNNKNLGSEKQEEATIRNNDSFINPLLMGYPKDSRDP